MPRENQQFCVPPWNGNNLDNQFIKRNIVQYIMVSDRPIEKILRRNMDDYTL